MPEMKNLDAVIRSARTLSFSASEVFGAFQQPERLALWWGPKGFTNTFEQFEFKPSGLWVFVMHAPNGASYPNESVFDEIIPNEKIVLRHVCAPHFVLTITLTACDGGTHLVWEQKFESVELAVKMRKLSTAANEENLDRLEALLGG